VWERSASAKGFLFGLFVAGRLTLEQGMGDKEVYNIDIESFGSINIIHV